MAYKPTVWVDGETPVNAENLNKMEQGIASAVVSVNGIAPDKNGNVNVAGGGSGEVDMNEVMNHVRANLTAEDVGAIPSEGRKVENANIAFGAITNGLLANKAVTAEKLADDVIPSIVSDVLASLPTWTGGSY